jgi:pimeloyl-ACP methyl ester carboxylesterase
MDPSLRSPYFCGGSNVFDDFQPGEIDTGERKIFFRRGGQGMPLLILHGFPQTHVMWRIVGPLLSENFEVVCADLRGYGRSGCPASTPDHAPYSKRAMAEDMVRVMERLGFPHFSVAGHDRGGRVAYAEALQDAAHVHAICEEYRAAATIDREHDAVDYLAGRRIMCPLFAIWSARGPVGTWYDRDGGPLGLWRLMSHDPDSTVLDAGHFFPEEAPDQTAEALNNFFLADRGDPMPHKSPPA